MNPVSRCNPCIELHQSPNKIERPPHLTHISVEINIDKYALHYKCNDCQSEFVRVMAVDKFDVEWKAL
jgi:Zn finger protein HypA/HybF involved in hydrogenase expression